METTIDNPTHTLLWAHLVSEHAACVSPLTSQTVLETLHQQEHEGPCTIRNHDKNSFHFSMVKLGKVLSEAEE
jgi:hypothetical protein